MPSSWRPDKEFDEYGSFGIDGFMRSAKPDNELLEGDVVFVPESFL